MSEVDRQPARVGLTGGIGSGKSTVATMFSELGIAVLDLDAVGHDVLNEDADVQRRIVERFGTVVCDAGGRIDRGRLADEAFADPRAVADLNSIVHPAIWHREETWLQQQTDASYVVIEAPVLIEAGAGARMDAVVVILAEEAKRRRRIASRPGYASRFDDIAARQCSDAERRKAADYLIMNDTDMNELRRQVEQLHGALLMRFGS